MKKTKKVFDKTDYKYFLLDESRSEETPSYIIKS